MHMEELADWAATQEAQTPLIPAQYSRSVMSQVSGHRQDLSSPPILTTVQRAASLYADPAAAGGTDKAENGT